MHRFLFLFLSSAILVQIGHTSQGVSYSKCFTRITRRSISNYSPIAEYKLSSIVTCMQHCIMASQKKTSSVKCVSFTYNNKMHSCQLFDNDGYKIPAVAHPALDIDLYTRNDRSCGEPDVVEKVLQANPNFISLNGESTFKEDVIEETQSARIRPVSTNDITSFRTHDIPNTRDTFTRQINSNAPLVKIDGHMKIPHDEDKEDFEMTESPRKVTTSDTLSSDAECSTSNSYYVVLGTEIEKEDENDDRVEEIENVDQGDCARFCSSNAAIAKPNFNCKSLNYYPETRKCELYSIQVEPNGPGKFLANPSTIYSEKFCLPKSPRLCQQDEVFILHVQMRMDGDLIGTQIAHGITPCLDLCLNNNKCMSAVYIDDSNTCELYSDEIGKNPSVLKETTPGSVVIENTCAATGADGVENNSEWSDCSFKVSGQLVKIKTTADGDMKVQRC